ncbi:WbuC family cupin fold metalloprotein [Sphingomonas sp. CFBP 8760]|uniref:WbuC family cupin fold metalloprotein n=1 Tax=Sphingomonas sp. CFBP 8760 TaxID=2775282 RepID=UPI001782ADF6|nr:WbuC family cupin fold metalloprotein [Sphingomonas sp. CFBP 8760]MBD8548168.1 WbuC family cupin fold metalloprotein [Sphingomonas sp. CFBP 8760]
MTAFGPDTLAKLQAAATTSSRRRQHLNLHDSYEEPCQRFLNALHADSYIRPHRHTLDPKEELLVAISGALALLTFDEAGMIATIVPFSTEAHWRRGAPFGVRVSPLTWHSVVPLTDQAILLEVKAGPFDPQAAKEPALWAPDEGNAEAAQSYLRDLRRTALRSDAVRDQLARSAIPDMI